MDIRTLFPMNAGTVRTKAGKGHRGTLSNSTKAMAQQAKGSEHMLHDLYRKQKTSPQKAVEGQFLLGIYRLEGWKDLVEISGFSPGTLVELDYMDQSRTLHGPDNYYGYCLGFVHPLKVRKEATVGIDLHCR